MAVAGFFYCILLFLCSFIAVELVRLAKLGLESLNRKKVAEKSKPRKRTQKPREVYYVVEKKQERAPRGKEADDDQSS